MEADQSMEILAAIVAGLLALVGGFVGAWTSRRSEYQKWLRQERSAVFSRFLQVLHDAWVECVRVINDSNLNDNQADERITETFVALESQQNIVRLYLFEGDRDLFTSLVRRLWAAQTRRLEQGKRMEVTRGLVNAIQQVLERRLHG